MKHLIKIESTPHGVLGVRHTGLDQQYCEAGKLVILEWQPDAKWGLQEAHYTDSDGNIVPIDLERVKVNGKEVVVFTMPNANITVGGTFKRFVVQDWTEGQNPNIGHVLTVGNEGEPTPKSIEQILEDSKIRPPFVEETLSYYISAASNKWGKDGGTDLSGKFFDVSKYRGKYIRFYDLVKTADIPSSIFPITSSYAFTTTTDHTPNTAPSYCANYRLTAICEEGVLVYIPNDANYIWIYTRRNGKDVEPKFEILDDNEGKIVEYSTIDAYNMFVNAMNDKVDELNLEMTIYDAAGYVYASQNRNSGKGSSLAKLYAIANINPIINTIWSQKDTVKIKELYHGRFEYTCASTLYVNDAKHKALTDYYNILGGKTGSISPYYLLGCIVQISDGRTLAAWIRKEGETDSVSRYSEMKKVLDCAVDALDNNGSGIAAIEATYDNVNSAQVYLLPSNYTPNYDFSVAYTNIYSYNPDTDLPIASNTKVLTLLTALDFVSDLDALVKIDPSDLISAEGGTDTTPILSTGDLFTFRELMLAAMLPSCNTAANAIAKYVGNILLNRKYITNQ